MSILSWGKCSLKKATSTAGVPGTSWTDITTPKEDTTKLTSTAGAEKTATIEGGEVIDYRRGSASYQIEFDIFVQKGQERPFDDNDGIIAGEHAIRIIPEDTTCFGCQIDRLTLSCEENFTTADGFILHYVGKCLKPAEGKTVKPYTASTDNFGE